MMKLRINPLVLTDLKESRNYIAEDNAEKAAETINKIYSKFEKFLLRLEYDLRENGADICSLL